MRRRLGTILLLAGGAALVWCLTVLAGSLLYNWYETWRLKKENTRAPHVILIPPPRPHEVIGHLEIPRLHISAVVLEGDDDSDLRYGAGHVPGTALPDQTGNVGIAGHRDTFFRPLRHIEPHDDITFTTPGGAHRYTVESTEIVKPADVRVLAASRSPELTLITCYPFYFVGPAPLRFVVHARRADSADPVQPAAQETDGAITDPGIRSKHAEPHPIGRANLPDHRVPTRRSSHSWRAGIQSRSQPVPPTTQL